MTLAEIPIVIVLPPVRKDPDRRMLFVQTGEAGLMVAGRINDRRTLQTVTDAMQHRFGVELGVALRELDLRERCIRHIATKDGLTAQK